MDGGEQVTRTVVAHNLPEHAGNPIHTDAGARAAGFDGALVAGVTSYAYCCGPVMERFGPEWVASGEAEVRFRVPVSDGDLLRLPVSERTDGGLDVAAMVDRVASPLVEMSAWRVNRGVDEPRPGQPLRPLTVRLEGEYGGGYAERAGDHQPMLAHDIVHPAVWPALANSVVHDQLARGPWVHTRSVIRHLALVPAGTDAVVSAVLVRRYHRGGERAVADVVVRVDRRVVATMEHEAIIDLASPPPTEPREA